MSCTPYLFVHAAAAPVGSTVFGVSFSVGSFIVRAVCSPWYLRRMGEVRSVSTHAFASRVSPYGYRVRSGPLQAAFHSCAWQRRFPLALQARCASTIEM